MCSGIARERLVSRRTAAAGPCRRRAARRTPASRSRTSGDQSGSPWPLSGWSLGKASRPCVVPRFGDDRRAERSATATSSATASRSVTRLPARMAGFLGREERLRRLGEAHPAAAGRGYQWGRFRPAMSAGSRPRHCFHLHIDRQRQKHRARSAASAPFARPGARRRASPRPARLRTTTSSRAGRRSTMSPHRIGSSNISRRSCWPAVTSSGVPSRKAL